MHSPPLAMNEDENEDLVLLDEPELDAADLVESEIEPLDDDYEPTQEVILLDMRRLDEDDLLDVA